MKTALGLIMLCIGAVILTGCSHNHTNGKNGPMYLARVGSSYLTVSEAKSKIPDYAYKNNPVQALKKYRKHWINRQLELQEAHRKNLTNQKEVKQRLAEARQEVLLDALKTAVLSKHKKETAVSDSAAINYYHRHHKKLILKQRFVKFRQVATHYLSTARQARNQLRDDSSWVEVARNFSINPGDKIKKSTKFWPVSSLFNNFPQMKKYVSRLDSGQISPIQRFNGVYQFIQIVDVREKGQSANPEWFIGQLKEWLRLDNQREYYDSYVKNLYFKAKRNNQIELYNVDSTRLNGKIDSTNTKAYE